MIPQCILALELYIFDIGAYCFREMQKSSIEGRGEQWDYKSGDFKYKKYNAASTILIFAVF